MPWGSGQAQPVTARHNQQAQKYLADRFTPTLYRWGSLTYVYVCDGRHP